MLTGEVPEAWGGQMTVVSPREVLQVTPSIQRANFLALSPLTLLHLIVA